MDRKIKLDPWEDIGYSTENYASMYTRKAGMRIEHWELAK